MPSADDYAQGLLDQPAEEAEATTYDATQREVNESKDTVQGQLDSVLDKDSDYIKRAKVSGQQYAQGRGLLNSSMGAQATHAAAIDAAMPIAQQDADTNFRQGLENQAADNTAKSTNSQLETNVATSNAANDAAARDAALKELGATDRTEIGEAGATEREQMKNDTATLLQQMKDDASRFETELRELSQTERQQIIADTDIATNDARIAAELLMNDSKISSADKKTFSEAFNEMSRQNYVEITKIQTDPDLSVTAKNRLTSAQNARYAADTQLLSDLYQVDLAIEAGGGGDTGGGGGDTGGGGGDTGGGGGDTGGGGGGTADDLYNENGQRIDASGNVLSDSSGGTVTLGSKTYTKTEGGLLIDSEGNVTTGQAANKAAEREEEVVRMKEWGETNGDNIVGNEVYGGSKVYKALKAQWEKDFPNDPFPYIKNDPYEGYGDTTGGGGGG